MKREEALRIIKECKEKGFKHTFYTLNEYHTALDIAIKALEQEPCEDAISREWLKTAIHNFYYGLKHTPTEEDIQAYIDVAPSVKQEPCEDAISRQEVLDAIDVKAWEFCDYLISKNRNDEQKPVSHFADNLRECVREELPSVKPQEPKWIPVSERLPEEYTNVLCWYEYFRYGNYNKMYQTYGVGTYFGRFGWAGDITGEKARVIAWMPLPKPYKAESEDKE